MRVEEAEAGATEGLKGDDLPGTAAIVVGFVGKED